MVSSPLTDVQASYIAGIIDGEGYISLNRKKNNSYQLKLDVKNTSLELCKRLQEWTKCGGIGAPFCKGNRQPCHAWRASSEKALAVLLAAKPHLLVKSKECALAIEYQQLLPKKRREEGKKFSDALKALHAPAKRREYHARLGEGEMVVESGAIPAIRPQPVVGVCGIPPFRVDSISSEE